MNHKVLGDIGLSPNEAADVLGVSRSSIYRLMEQGSLRFIKLGRRTVIPQSAVDQLLNPLEQV